MTFPYLDRPLVRLTVALPRMLEQIEADLADMKVSAAGKWCLRQRAELMRGLFSQKQQAPHDRIRALLIVGSADCLTVPPKGKRLKMRMIIPTLVGLAALAAASAQAAPVPTKPTPRTRSVSGSKISLVKPSVRSRVAARPEAAQGKRATFTSRF